MVNLTSEAHDASAVSTEGASGDESDGLRILMVSALFAPHVGGTEIHTSELGAELVRRGHSVTVATSDSTGKLPKEEIIDGVRLVRFKAYPRFGDLYFTPGLWSFITSQQWDVIHVQGYHTLVAPLALAAARRTDAVVVASFHSGGHSSRFRQMIRPLQSRLLSGVLNDADRLVAVSQFEADQFINWLHRPADSVAVIPNATQSSASEFDDVASGIIDPESDDVVIVSVGRLVRYKGHHRMIEAMPAILEAIPKARLLILGDGPKRNALLKQAAKLGVEDRVTIDYIPVKERDRLYAVMRESSAAVLLSDYESHGMAAHEALTADLPLVVVDNSALGELVEVGAANGVSVDADASTIASAVTETIANPPVRTGPAPVSEDWATVAERVEALYLQAIADRAEPHGSQSERS